MESKLTIAQNRDLICDKHGEIEYVDSLIQRLESKQFASAYKKSIEVAQTLIDCLKEAELKLESYEDFTSQKNESLYSLENADDDTSVFEPLKPRQYQASHRSHESA